MPDRTRGYAHRVDLRASVEEVWRHLIEPAQLKLWCASAARVDAREGGSFWLRSEPSLTREAHIDVFLPPRRLRLIYMPLPDLPDDDGVIVDDFLLDADPAVRADGARATVVRLLGSGVPETPAWDAMYVQLRLGWERALLRLKALLERTPTLKPKD